MAKRKRLTPARPDFIGTAAQPDAALRPADPAALPDSAGQSAPESKSMFPRPGPSAGPRPPIAQVAGEASVSAALTELTDLVAAARREGRLVEALPLAQIDAAHLVRDRLASDEEELQALIDSLRARGQQTPIEVVDRGAQARPRYGLISGWRRLTALQRLATENTATIGAGRSAPTVLALIRRPETSSDAYVAMVEENEIRAGLSFYERARIVLRALQEGVYSDPKSALQTLFANVSRSKRSKIKSFMVLVEMLDGSLRFPTAIGEKTGLELARKLEEDPEFGPALAAHLRRHPAASAEAERALLMAFQAGTEPISARQSPRDAGKDGADGPAVAQDRGGETGQAAPALTVAYDPEAGWLRLEGPGVDAALYRDLRAWLQRRGGLQ